MIAPKTFLTLHYHHVTAFTLRYFYIGTDFFHKFFCENNPSREADAHHPLFRYASFSKKRRKGEAMIN